MILIKIIWKKGEKMKIEKNEESLKEEIAKLEVRLKNKHKALENIYNRGLSTVQSKFANIDKILDINTIQHACEIQNDRRANLVRNKYNTDLIYKSFVTADFSLYVLERKEVVLYLADREHNLILKNLDDAITQFKTTDNYFPKDADIGAVMDAKTTLRIKLSNLDLNKYDRDLLYYCMDARDYGKLNSTQKKFAERIHGTGKDFKENMDMIVEKMARPTEWSWQNNNVHMKVLNPEWVRIYLQENNARSLARLSTLADSNYFSFSAGDKLTDVDKCECYYDHNGPKGSFYRGIKK